MAEIVTTDIDNTSNLQNWEKEALFKTLIRESGMNYEMADFMVCLYSNSCTYKGNIPENVMDKILNKIDKIK